MSFHRPRFVDFFAGSGLVTEGVKHCCQPVWANDFCAKKAAIYRANHGHDHFHLGAIEEVCGAEIPAADIAWASFPCQDLSLAGKMQGLQAARSGLFWQWLRVLDEMPSQPAVIALENVVGLLSANQGEDFAALCTALQERDYRVGPMLLDAKLWVPQSRPRVFVVAVKNQNPTGNFEDCGANWLHPEPVRKAIEKNGKLVFWSMSRPTFRRQSLVDLIEWDAPVDGQTKSAYLLSLIPAQHRKILEIPVKGRAVYPGYRRTRKGKQVLELRFDNISGCLRTAEGGSSRQFLILHDRGAWHTRLVTARETARLMGAPESYQLSPVYNQSYNAMGDAVVVPAVRHLMDHLLEPLWRRCISNDLEAVSTTAGVRLFA